jgi:hypothetical protein
VENKIKWKFFDFVEGGQNPIENWYANDLSDEGRFKFDSLIKDSAKIENHQHWGYKPLQGEAKKEHIWELKFIADDKQHRVMGIFHGEKQAVLLIGCVHKGKVYTPPNAIETAITRAKAVRGKKQGVTLSERKIKSDR